jgi:N-acetylmuramoyl-L-alanine amidase
MIRCESEGEGENGMKAVASVIMNRVNVAYGEYLREGQGNLRRVLQQPYQFTCYLTEIGGVANPQNVFNMSPRGVDYEIADWALSGYLLQGVDHSLWYMNPFVQTCPDYFPYNRSGVIHNRIGEHCFFIPTAFYAQT